MSARRRFLALALGGLLAAWAIAGDDDDENTDVFPQVLAIHYHHAKAPASATLAKSILPALRKAYEEKQVLFLTIDLTTKGSTHQGRLLLNALGWNDKFEKPGTLVLVNANTALPIGTYNAKSDLKEIRAALDKALKPPADEEDGKDDEDDDDDGEAPKEIDRGENDGGRDSSVD